MRPLKYSINVTLDGCVDHRVGVPDAELHDLHAANIARADAMILGRVTYQMMEEAWRAPFEGPEWMAPFARTMDAVKKYVVSSTLQTVDWNSELLRGDLRTAVQELKDQPGNGLATGGVTLPFALAELGLIDEYELVVSPRIAGHGPRLLDGLSQVVALELVGQRTLTSGSVALRYVPA